MELSRLLNGGLDWMARYSLFSSPHSTEPNLTQAIIAAALHAMQRCDLDAFIRINQAENLSYIQYPFMKDWMRDEHTFLKEDIERCLKFLAWLVVRKMIFPHSPLVTAVTGLEDKYELYGVYIEAVISCVEGQKGTVNKKAVGLKCASTQTCSKKVQDAAIQTDERVEISSYGKRERNKHTEVKYKSLSIPDLRLFHDMETEYALAVIELTVDYRRQDKSHSRGVVSKIRKTSKQRLELDCTPPIGPLQTFRYCRFPPKSRS